MSKEKGGSAFPLRFHEMADNGMTLRDYFAAASLQGLIAHLVGIGDGGTVEKYAERAYKYADAMLEARIK